MSSVAQQVRDSLKAAGGTLSMAQLTEANSWDANEKASAYVAIAAMRKAGNVETFVEDGTTCHRLIDGTPRPARIEPKKAKTKAKTVSNAASASPAAPAPQVPATDGARVKRKYTKRVKVAKPSRAPKHTAAAVIETSVGTLAPADITDKSLRILIAATLMHAPSPLGATVRDALIEAAKRLA